MTQCREIKLFLLLFTAVLFLAGCSSGGGGGNPQNTGAALGSQPYNSASQWGGPDRLSDLTGKVKTVRGNKLSVFKVLSSNENMSDSERAKYQSEMQSLSPEERARRREEMNKVTDETFDILIPVGTPIVKGNLVDGKVQATKLEVGDIKEGDQLKLWLEKQPSAGDLSVEFVQVQQSIN